MNNDYQRQKRQIVIMLVLLLIIGLANYKNYYSPHLITEKILDFSHFSNDSGDKLENVEKNNLKNVDEDENSDDSNDKSQNDKTEDYGANYINYAVDSDGSLVKWNKKLLAVYVEPSKYTRAIYSALSTYNSYFQEYFKFGLASKRENADITIDVVDSIKCDNSTNEFYMAGYTNTSFAGEDRHLTKANIQLLSKKPNSSRAVSNREMYNVAIHEIGHAIGIIGHSPCNKDALYAFTSDNSGKLTDRDISTIKLMYSNDKELIKKETANFVQTKLSEAEHYAEQSPKKVISWINLARTYYDAGKKDSALNAYKKALSLEPSNYMIYQSMAECYYSSEKYDTAIKYYTTAISYIKTEQEKLSCYSMIGNCYAKKDDYATAYTYFKKVLTLNDTEESYLKNYLIACVQLDKKQEALTAINNFKSKTGKDLSKDTIIAETMRWINTK